MAGGAGERWGRKQVDKMMVSTMVFEGELMVNSG